MDSRWKNYGLWVSMFALIGLLLTDFGIFPTNYDLYVQILLAIFIAAGIVNNPSVGTGYLDKESTQS